MLLYSVLAFPLFFVLYLALPFIFERFPRLYRSFVFKPKDEWGNKEEHFTCFEKHQLSSASARNFYVETSDTCDRLGVWHVLPFEHEIASGTKRVDLGSFDEALSCGTPIFLYFHGNTKTRSVPWRVDIYKLLSAAGYNVITFDYRGYGDSSGHMTAESDCVYDSLAVLKFIYDHCGSSPVFFWGHSLGTGIVGSLMRHLLEQRERYSSNIRLPRGIILDAPFTCLAHVMMSRKSMWAYRVVPQMRRKVTTIASNLKVEFDTQNNLSGCPVPILILHAKDDPLVPFRLGAQLAESLRKNSPVQFVSFEADRGYRHNFIHTAPEMPQIVRKFVADCTT